VAFEGELATITDILLDVSDDTALPTGLSFCDLNKSFGVLCR